MQIPVSSEPLFLNVCIVVCNTYYVLSKIQNPKWKIVNIKNYRFIIEECSVVRGIENKFGSSNSWKRQDFYSLKPGIHFLNKRKKFQSSWIISYTIEMELCYHTPFRLPILLSQITPSSSKCPIMHHKFSFKIYTVSLFSLLF